MADQTVRSVSDSLRAAQEAATGASSERAARTAELEQSLKKISALRSIAQKLDPEAVEAAEADKVVEAARADRTQIGTGS
jgi:hypothetical protein